MAKIVGIDLFCGIGGLTHGLVKSGIEIRAGFDIDKTCKKSFSQSSNGNPEFVCENISKLTEKDFLKYFNNINDSDYKLVAGCAPCQPYSAHQKNKDLNARSKHKSYGLIKQYLRVVKYVNPHFVIMENVRELGKDPYFQTEFLDYFKKNGYTVKYEVINMENYGAPQRRKRLLFVAIKSDLEISNNFEILKKTNNKSKTIFDAIGSLPKLKAGETDPKDPIHTSSKLSDLNIKRIKHSVPGGTWRDWPEELLLECYKKDSGKTYSSVYGRVSPFEVSPTLTTQFTRYGTGRYGHYDQDRGLSLREGAILQTFPNDYVFDTSIGITAISRQIGNAVPPIFAETLGEEIIKKLKI